MKIIYKFTSTLLAITMLFSLVSCSRLNDIYGQPSDNQTPSVKKESTAGENNPALDYPSEEPAPTEEPVLTEEPASTKEPAPTEEPVPSEEPVPTEKPVPEVELCAVCAATEHLAAHQTATTTVVLCDSCYGNLQNAAGHYMTQLERVSEWYTNFGLFDMNEDGIPELFMDQGTEIHSVAPNGVSSVSLFESMVVLTLYVDAASRQMMAGYIENGACQMYSLYKLADDGFEEVENKWGDGAQEGYLAIASRMTQVEYEYVIENEDSLLEDLISAAAK